VRLSTRAMHRTNAKILFNFFIIIPSPF